MNAWQVQATTLKIPKSAYALMQQQLQLQRVFATDFNFINFIDQQARFHVYLFPTI